MAGQGGVLKAEVVRGETTHWDLATGALWRRTVTATLIGVAHLLMAWTTPVVASFALFATPVQAVAPESAKAQWVTLGTAGGPRLHANQAQIANAALAGDAVYLFDVGNGVLRQMAAAKLPVRNVRAISLSHHHVDHNADVGPLMMSTWLFGAGKPVPVFGPDGTKHLVNGLAAANEPTALAFFPVAGPAQRPLASVFSPTDLPSHMNAPQVVYEDANVRVIAITVDHFQVKPSVPTAKMPEAVLMASRPRGGVTFTLATPDLRRTWRSSPKGQMFSSPRSWTLQPSTRQCARRCLTRPRVSWMR